MRQNSNLIGARVRISRYAKNPKLTQINLMKLLQLEGLDINQAQLSKIEHGIRPVSDIEVAVFAKVLNVSASWLLGEINDSKRLS